MRARRGPVVARAAAIAAVIFLLHVSCDEPGGPGPLQYCEFQLQFPYDQQPILLTGDTGRVILLSTDGSGITSPGTAAGWSSSSPDVARVDSTGLVTGVHSGFTYISADVCSGFSNLIEVVGRPVTIEILPDTLRMVPGNRGHIVFVLRDASGDEVSHWLPQSLVRLVSADPAVVGIDPDPIYRSVTALAEGTARVTATTGDASSTLTVIVAATTLGAPDAGMSHTCAISSDSLAYCWGNTDWLVPQSDAPGTLWGPAPRALPWSLRFATLVSGGSHACGLTPDAALYCIGDNYFGQLGVGAEGPVAGPVQVMTGTQFASVSAGAAHTCALTSDGRVFCWGVNIAGELGSSTAGECTYVFLKAPGITVPCSRAPLQVDPELTFASVRAGSGLSCGRTTGGDTYCWGGQYGREPTLVGAGLGLDSIDLGGGGYFLGVDTVALACGLDPAGAAYCWGKSSHGLGDGSTTESWAPVPVSGGLTFQALSVGLGVCGLTEAGAIYCWGGAPSGFAAGATPAQVPGGLTFTTVSAGAWHGCGRATDERVYCWGANSVTQLGVSGPDRAIPVRVLGQR